MRTPFYLCILALALCAGLSRADGFSDLLTANQAKWKVRQPAHYFYQYRYSCFCQPGTWQVEVKNGTVKEIKQIDSGSTQNPIPENPNIDSVFAWIRAAKAGNPDELKVTFDAGFGFPSAIYLDRSKLIADEERSISITHFQSLLEGVSLSPDTVFTENWPGVVDSMNSVRIHNVGYGPLYLNSVEMSVSPADTFPVFGAALRFQAPLSGYMEVVDWFYLRKTNSAGTDTTAELPDGFMPPGGGMRLSRFQFDPCFCLLKSGAKISEGDPVTLLLRLNFSGSPQSDSVAYRAYLWVRAKYGYTSGIAGRPGIRVGNGNGTGRPVRGPGRFPLADRVFTADGRNLEPTRASGAR